jgi:hypothetical protein
VGMICRACDPCHGCGTPALPGRIIEEWLSEGRLAAEEGT